MLELVSSVRPQDTRSMHKTQLHLYLLTEWRNGTEIKNAIPVKVAPNKILKYNLREHV